ncbi:MAG: PaaI family thioesterase [Acidimicrobiia bacterium]|nr:PaaI family thioesterase [Acidimicrobiia bacterium]
MVERAERAAELLAEDPYAQSLAIRLVEVTDESITVEMDVTETHHNFSGSTHGGALFSLADCAFSLASNVPGGLAVAIDTHLAITAATTAGDTLRAVVQEITRGRTLATYRVLITRLADDRVCGTFTGTVYVMPSG